FLLGGSFLATLRALYSSLWKISGQQGGPEPCWTPRCSGLNEA
ncbi:hypothetical protein LEMLEM_LOCUS6756, partial [Lemmus lemmus]